MLILTYDRILDTFELNSELYGMVRDWAFESPYEDRISHGDTPNPSTSVGVMLEEMLNCFQCPTEVISDYVGCLLATTVESDLQDFYEYLTKELDHEITYLFEEYTEELKYVMRDPTMFKESLTKINNFTDVLRLSQKKSYKGFYNAFDVDDNDKLVYVEK